VKRVSLPLCWRPEFVELTKVNQKACRSLEFQPSGVFVNTGVGGTVVIASVAKNSV
jgi:hypothetical protein